MKRTTIKTEIYELDKIAHFKISYQSNQKVLIKSLCEDALKDLKIATIPANINVARSGNSINFQVSTAKIKKAMIQLITQAIKNLN